MKEDKKSQLEMYLENKNKDWDLFEMPEGHANRFMQKLQQEQTLTAEKASKKSYRKYLQVAAVAIPILFVSIIGLRLWSSESHGSTPANQTIELSEYDSDLDEAQNYFAYAVEEKLVEIKSLENEDNHHVIEESLERIEDLDEEYQILVNDLKESGGNPDVIKSILSNLQLKVEILEQLLEQIEYIKNIKNQQHETI